MNRLFAVCALGVSGLFICCAAALKATPAELTWEEANARRMFVLCSRERGWSSAIVVDTTRPEDLRAAIKLQDLVYRIGGARLPIVDREFKGVPWDKIHLSWDYHPMKPRKHPFTIQMKQTNPRSANPPKQIVIAGAPPATLAEAVSSFTKAAFGIPLEALDDKDFKWHTRKVLAIPEDFGPIHADGPDRKADK